MVSATTAVSIHKSLILNISSLMLLLGGSIFAVMFYCTRKQINSLSSQLVLRALLQTHAEL